MKCANKDIIIKKNVRKQKNVREWYVYTTRKDTNQKIMMVLFESNNHIFCGIAMIIK